jgi:hypothetical protein
VASRLYRTTRPLCLQVTGALDQLGVAAVGSPTTAILIALYVTGLILLDARPTADKPLPGR